MSTHTYAWCALFRKVSLVAVGTDDGMTVDSEMGSRILWPPTWEMKGARPDRKLQEWERGVGVQGDPEGSRGWRDQLDRVEGRGQHFNWLQDANYPNLLGWRHFPGCGIVSTKPGKVLDKPGKWLLVESQVSGLGNFMGGGTWSIGAGLVVQESQASSFRHDVKYPRWRHTADRW